MIKWACIVGFLLSGAGLVLTGGEIWITLAVIYAVGAAILFKLDDMEKSK